MAKSAREWLDQLRSPDREERHRAKLKLGGLTPKDSHLLDGLADALSSQDQDRVFWSLAGIACLAKSARGAAPRVAQLLDHPIFGIRQAAVYAISRIGTFDRQLALRISKVLRDDENPFVRSEAACALRSLPGGEAGVRTALVGALSDPEAAVRLDAATTLKLLAPHEEEFLDAIRNACADPQTDLAVRDQLEVAIRRSRPPAKRAGASNKPGDAFRHAPRKRDG